MLHPNKTLRLVFLHNVLIMFAGWRGWGWGGEEVEAAEQRSTCYRGAEGLLLCVSALKDVSRCRF